MGLRDKYKSVKIDALKNKVDEENDLIGMGGLTDYLTIDEGTNKLKLFPPHDGTDFYALKRECWISIEKDDGEMGRRTVLNSRVHGGTKLDIIEEYIKFAKENLADSDDLKKLTDWKEGISYDLVWIAYALKISKNKREFGIVNFKKTVRDAINKELFVEDESEPIEVDPFTDVDSGLPLLVTYNKKPNKKKGEDYYTVSVGRKAIAIEDEELEVFDKAKSLIELTKDVYSISDFNLALEGIENYDAESGFDLFEDERWEEIVEKVKAQYAASEEDEEEDEDEEETPKRKPAKKSKPVVEEDEDEEEDEEDDLEEEDEEDDLEEEDEDDGDEFDEMDRLALRKHIKKNKLEIAVKKSMSDDAIRDAIRDYEEDEVEDEEDEEDEVEETPKKKGKLSMDEIRARLKNK